VATVKAGYDSWFFVTADYVFGRDLERITSAFVKANGGNVLGSLRAPLNTADFSSFLLQAQASPAKVVGLANAGLVSAVAKRSFTALVGASGTGKSSVVLAGLAARLGEQGHWRSTYFRIGTEDLFTALARALAPLLADDEVVDRMVRIKKLAKALSGGDLSTSDVIAQCRAANPGKRILLIADQFEEAFTLVHDEALRNRFVDALIAAFPDPAQGEGCRASFLRFLPREPRRSMRISPAAFC
jgi:conflict system STAND superfamily ATPase/substrate-binding family protein